MDCLDRKAIVDVDEELDVGADVRRGVGDVDERAVPPYVVSRHFSLPIPTTPTLINLTTLFLLFKVGLNTDKLDSIELKFIWDFPSFARAKILTMVGDEWNYLVVGIWVSMSTWHVLITTWQVQLKQTFK